MLRSSRITEAKNSSVSLFHRGAQEFVEAFELLAIGRGDAQVADLQPLAGEIFDKLPATADPRSSV